MFTAPFTLDDANRKRKRDKKKKKKKKKKRDDGDARKRMRRNPSPDRIRVRQVSSGKVSSSQGGMRRFLNGLEVHGNVSGTEGRVSRSPLRKVPKGKRVRFGRGAIRRESRDVSPKVREKTSGKRGSLTFGPQRPPETPEFLRNGSSSSLGQVSPIMWVSPSHDSCDQDSPHHGSYSPESEGGSPSFNDNHVMDQDVTDDPVSDDAVSENVDPNSNPIDDDAKNDDDEDDEDDDDWWQDDIQKWFYQKSHNTTTRYKSILDKFVAFLKAQDIDGRDVTTINLAHMQTWIESLEDVSNDTRRKYAIVLKSFWKSLYAHMSVERNVALALKLPPRSRRLKTNKYLSKEDVYQFLVEARKNSCVHVAIFGFMYFAGMRVAEVTELKDDDVEFIAYTKSDGSQGWKTVVHIRGEAAKGSRYRDVKIGKTGTKYLKAQVEHLLSMADNDYLFPGNSKDPKTGEIRGNRGTESVYRIVKKLAKRVNIPKVTPHWFRHAFASHAKERGVDLKTISKALGHSSVKTTEIYLQSGQEAGDF